jgi:D-glycero-alpha-D-manno-heptose 1-phosphate guanylyltransferase
MEAIVLAGGFGTRLRALVPDLPKPMAPVAGRPFLEILLESMARQGFDRVVLAVGYLADRISAHFGTAFVGLSLAYVLEDTPLGTGGAVRAALERCRDAHVYVFNGDTFLDLEVAEVERHWHTHRAPIIIGRAVPDLARYGALRVVGGRVTGFLEKGRSGSGLINAGCYVLPRNLLDAHAIGAPFSLETDFLAGAVATSRFDFFQSRGLFIDIGVPEDYVRAQTLLAQRR